MTKITKASLQKEISKYSWVAWIALVIVIGVHALLYQFFRGSLRTLLGESQQAELALVLMLLASATLTMALIAHWMTNRTSRVALKIMSRELHELRLANNRAKWLQAMASTLRATLSFERVVEAALDVCGLALEEMGAPARSVVGAVFLFNGKGLQPIAHRRFIGSDAKKQIAGEQGIVAEALEQAVPLVTETPGKDPELKQYMAFQDCYMATCIPLRAGFQIFGAIVLGWQVEINLDDDYLDLFNSVADQAVIALQNGQLYQALEAEKNGIIEAEEEARKKLARDLHDGPTQSVATIAMRINFIRSLLKRDPREAVQELEKVEELAKETSKEIRGMLFTLRPLVLESQGLGAAIEMAMSRIRESEPIKLQLIGSEYGDLLNERAQGVVFYVIEEALGNARKHSRADLIEVHLWQEHDLFVARVSDDGVGFNTQSVIDGYNTRGSLGMVNMRERAELIDGSLKLESAPGRGTSITLVVPLNKHGRSQGSNGRSA